MNRKTLSAIGRWALISALSAVAFMPGPRQAQALTINLGSGTTAYSVMNVSSSAATVVAQYYPPGGGSPSHSQTYTLASNARLRISLSNPADFPVSGPWQGSVVLSSDQDIVAAAVTQYTGRGAYDDGGAGRVSSEIPPDAGTESSAYEAFNTGDTTLYAPLVQRVPGPGSTARIASRITVQNTTGSTIQVFMSINREGTPLGTHVFTLNPFGSQTFDTANDTDPIVTAGLTGSPGQQRASLIITSTSPIAGVVEQNWDNPSTFQNWSGAYAMLTPSDAATTLFSPQAQRECRAATPCLRPDMGGAAPFRFNTYSSFTLLNVGTTTATVQAEMIPAGSFSGYYNQPITLNFQIPPQALFDINLLNGGSITPSNPLFTTLFDPLIGLNFRGSLRVTSSQPLVGVGFFQQPLRSSQNYVSAYGLVSPAGATNKIVAPWFDRDCGLSSPCPAPGPGVTVADYNSFSNLVIVNMGNTAATISSVEFYTQTGGSPILTLTGFSLPAGASYSINSRGGGDVSFPTMQSLSEKFFGTVVVNGAPGSQLKATVTIANSRVSDAYNTFNR